MREFLTNWLDGKKLSQKESTGERYEKPIREFLESLGVRADKSLGHLVPQDIERFRDTRTSAGVSLSTVSFDMQIIRSVLATATKQGLILSNPALTVELPRVKRQKRSIGPESVVECPLHFVRAGYVNQNIQRGRRAQGDVWG